MDENRKQRQVGEGPIDSHSIEWAIEEYADRLYAVALRITGSPEDAEDALQEAFLAAVNARDSFRAEARVSTWLHRIVVNASLRTVRSRQETSYLSDDGLLEGGIRDWSVDLELDTERSELGECLARGLQQLQPDIRAVVVLRDVEGLSASEAADILEISAAALKSRLHRGRLLLRRYLVVELHDQLS